MKNIILLFSIILININLLAGECIQVTSQNRYMAHFRCSSPIYANRKNFVVVQYSDYADLPLMVNRKYWQISTKNKKVESMGKVGRDSVDLQDFVIAKNSICEKIKNIADAKIVTANLTNGNVTEIINMKKRIVTSINAVVTPDITGFENIDWK